MTEQTPKARPSDRFFGLDIETTGTDPERHGIIQIGVSDLWQEATFVSDVQPSRFVEIDPEAMKVNGFTFDRIRAAPLDYEVDEKLAAWFKEHSPYPAATHIIGLNVASFDLQFVKKFLPKTYHRLSYRTIDLNAVFLTLAESRDHAPFDVLKTQAKEYAAEHVVGPERWHDAGYDAAAAVYMWEYLRILIQKGIPFPIPKGTP